MLYGDKENCKRIGDKWIATTPRNNYARVGYETWALLKADVPFTSKTNPLVLN